MDAADAAREAALEEHFHITVLDSVKVRDPSGDWVAPEPHQRAAVYELKAKPSGLRKAHNTLMAYVKKQAAAHPAVKKKIEVMPRPLQDRGVLCSWWGWRVWGCNTCLPQSCLPPPLARKRRSLGTATSSSASGGATRLFVRYVLNNILRQLPIEKCGMKVTKIEIAWSKPGELACKIHKDRLTAHSAFSKPVRNNNSSGLALLCPTAQLLRTRAASCMQRTGSRGRRRCNSVQVHWLVALKQLNPSAWRPVAMQDMLQSMLCSLLGLPLLSCFAPFVPLTQLCKAPVIGTNVQ